MPRRAFKIDLEDLSSLHEEIEYVTSPRTLIDTGSKSEPNTPKRRIEGQERPALISSSCRLITKGYFADIGTRPFVYLSSKDKLGRQIVVVEPSLLPPGDLDLEIILPYFKAALDPVVQDLYVVVFIGTSTTDKTNRHHALEWLKKTYRVVNHEYRKNLKSLYIVHASYWIRATLTLCRPFVSQKFWKKVVYIDNIDDIYKTIPPENISFSDYVIRHNLKLNSRDPVFGAPSLAHILLIEHSKTGVPEVFTKCVQYIRNHIEIEGLFRRNGSAEQIAVLRASFDHGEHVDLCQEVDPHTVVSLLKLFLRELGDPLFTTDLHEAFLQIQQGMGHLDEIWLPTMLSLLSTLPKPNLRCMKILFDLAQEIISHVSGNKMDTKNMAIVLAPALLRGKDLSPIKMMKETPICNSLVRKMMTHHEAIFGSYVFLEIG